MQLPARRPLRFRGREAMKLLLFDIDGTLLRAGGAGMRSIERAVRERFGVSGVTDGISADGKTDPMIFREALASFLPAGERLETEVAALTPVYERIMREEMPASAEARLLPGVVELLEALASRRGVTLGLLTGNLESTARVKLARFDLNRYFHFGAFASDDERRDRLPPVAVERAEQHLGRAVGLGRHVLVIGDTPRDVACALANGMTAVGVGAAHYSAQDLAAAGAHLTFEDLSNTAAVLAGFELD
jgi:phosphoglycolate phosphatase